MKCWMLSSLLSLLTPLVGEEDTEEEVVVMEEEAMVEVEAMEGVVVMEEEAMEGVGVATFKDHKGSLHQALASHPVQG